LLLPDVSTGKILRADGLPKLGETRIGNPFTLALQIYWKKYLTELSQNPSF